MRPIRLAILLCVLLAGGALGAGRAPGREQPEPVSPFAPLIQAVEQEMQGLLIPGASVAVLEGGELTFAQGFGSKHPHVYDPVQDSTLFRIGSVTKVLTAMGLLQLVDHEWVDMNAPITDYLPEFYFGADASWAPSIQVLDLLTHRSALADYLEIDAPGACDDQALSRFFHDVYPELPFAYLMAPAGRMYNYTNPGFMLAGLIAEVVNGDAYHRTLRDNVLAPLGMRRTFFLPDNVLADGDFASGSALHWETGEPTVVEPNSYDNGWGRPAGYAFSSVLDLAKLIQFLRAGDPEVLSESLHRAMQTPQVNMDMFLDLLHYGYGLMIQEGGFYRPQSASFYRMRMVAHGGDVPGFSADIYYVPSLDFGFIALANASYAHLSNSFAVALTTLNDLPAPSPVPSLSMSPSDYANYEGHYHDPFNAGDIVVRAPSRSNQLQVEIPAFDQAGVSYDSTLLANTPDNFILYLNGLTNFDRFPLQVTFIRDGHGNSEYFRTRSFVAALQTKDVHEPDTRGSGRASTLSLEPSRFKRIRQWPEPRRPFIAPPLLD